jgi:hypothetical protein
VTTDSPFAARVNRRLPALLKTLADDPIAVPSGPIAEETLRILVRCLYDGRNVADDDLPALRYAAVRHAEEGTSLATLVAGCYAAARLVLTTAFDEAAPDDEQLRVIGERVFRLLEHVSTSLTEAYFEEQHAIRAEDRDARRALASALISGDQVDWPEAHLGVRIAPAYVAVALQLGMPGALDGADGIAGAVAARRRLRRLQEQLDAFGREPVLGLLDSSGGTALLPASAERVQAMLDELPPLIAEIGASTGTSVLAGAAACVGVIAIARAARQARDVLHIAGRLGRPPGVYVLDDVLLEYQLTRDSDARPLLAGLLDPLETNPDLVQTLECYFEQEFDRRGTATTLHVHPNTLDYRLRRIAALTGLDPAKPSGQQLLAAALTARRLV